MKKPEDNSTTSHAAAMAEVRRVVAEAKELSGAADGALTDHLAAWIAGQYAIASRRLAAKNPDGAVDWNLLRALCHDVVDLRRGDHSAESLRIERERLEMERAEQKEALEKRFWEWAGENRGKICQDSNRTPEEKEKIMRRILGMSEPDESPATQPNGNRHPDGPACNPQPDKGG